MGASARGRCGDGGRFIVDRSIVMVYNSPTKEEDNIMTQRTNRRQFNQALAAAGALGALSPFGIVRAQSKSLKVGAAAAGGVLAAGLGVALTKGFGRLPAIENAPYFAAVDTESQIDLALAATLSGLEIDTLYALNPGINRWATDPEGPHRLLVPATEAARFEIGRIERKRSSRNRIPSFRRRPRRGDCSLRECCP